MKKFVIFFIYVPLVYSELHRFMTAYTAINGKTTAGTPEFSAVTTLDGQQIDYYDSDRKKIIPRKDVVKEFTSTELWKNYTAIREHVLQICKMQRFNQTDGLHTYQRMYGCEWDDETEESQGFDQHGYDGEDFISLDLNEDRYTASNPQRVLTAQKWNNEREQLEFLKHYYNHECVHLLKKLLKLRKADLEKRAPEVSLLQKNPSSSVVCHATGFYPSGVTITWLKNGINHYEDVVLGDLLPNEDGTFQKTSTLSVSPDEWKKDQFTCEVDHQRKTIQKILTEDEIKGNYRPTELYATILVCVMGVFLIYLVIGAVSYIKIKKRTNRYAPVSCSDEHLFIDKGE